MVKKVYKMKSSVLLSNNALLNKVVHSINFVTEVNFYHIQVKPGYLEQLALACPNIERLNLEKSYDCLTNLRGLQTVAYHCYNLCGLNLRRIPVTLVENHLKLWKILSGMKLTHLVIDFCALNPPFKSDPAYDMQLWNYFEKCTSLLALQVESKCEACDNSVIELSMLSHFPILAYCCIYNYFLNAAVQGVLDCKRLKIFCYLSVFSRTLPISTTSNTNLQQFNICASVTVSDVLLQMISAHGGLVHLALSVASITIEGICILITNSPELLTFYIQSKEKIYSRCPVVVISSIDDLKCNLPYSLHNRKLFTVGNCSFTCFYDNIPGTDMCSLWPNLYCH